MSIVLIKNLNLYKLYKDLPYTVNTAVYHLIDCLIKQSHDDKTVIYLYVNFDEKWMQFVSTNNLYPLKDKQTIWEHDLNVGTFDWKYPIFFLGQTISIELKNNDLGLTSVLDLNDDSAETTINDVDGRTILSKYNVATRLSVTDFNYNIDENKILELIDKLSNTYQSKINSGLLDLHVVMIKENKSYQTSHSNKMQIIRHTMDLQPIKANKHMLIETVKTELTHNKKTYLIECEVFNTRSPCVYLSNKNRVISGMERSLLSNTYFSDLDTCGVNIKVLNLKLNLYRTDFNWQLLPYDILMNHVQQKLSHYLVKPDHVTKQTKLITEQFDIEQLDDLKSLLTKSFNGELSTARFDDFEIKKDKLQFTYHADDNKKITINLIKTKQKEFKNEWLQLQLVKEDQLEQVYEYDVTFNVEHPFFRDFLNDKQFATKIEQFVICYAIAETICRLDGNNITQLKYEINKLLRGT